MNFWSNDFSEEYNWSNDYRPGELDHFSDLPQVPSSTLSIDLHYLANKFPSQPKPEITTGDGLEIFSVLFDARPFPADENKTEQPFQGKQEKEAEQAMCTRFRAEKGERFETKNLCKHLHTETANFLKKWAMINRPTKEELEMVRAFCSGSIAIDAFKTLFANRKFSEACRNYYQSKFFVKEIMGSKMDLKTKLVVIKYLDKVTAITHDRNFRSWKKDPKDFL